MTLYYKEYSPELYGKIIFDYNGEEYIVYRPLGDKLSAEDFTVSAYGPTATKPAAKGSGNIAVDKSAKGGTAKNNAPAPRKDGKTAGGLFSKLFKK